MHQARLWHLEITSAFVRLCHFHTSCSLKVDHGFDWTMEAAEYQSKKNKMHVLLKKKIKKEELKNRQNNISA